MNLKRYLPILQWLHNYQKADLKGDISAGLTVGVMLIPQGMAYAMIAGLPPVYGLYASIFPQIIYALFGTSRQLAVGPVAMDSLLVATAVGTMAVEGTQEYIALAIVLTLMMGIIQLSFGLLRLGFLVNFLSKPVISGFTSAVALIIGFNQLGHILGLNLGRSNGLADLLMEVFRNMGQIHWLTFSIAVLGMFIIKGVKKIHPAIPGALIAVVIGILLVEWAGLDAYGVKVVGAIPSGLPDFHIPDLSLERLENLFPIALTLSLIALMESISVAKSMEDRHQGAYQLDSNQEMIGLGMGNIVGSFFSSYPTAGGFGRSAVNDQSGARTNLANLISALLVALVLLFFSSLFTNLPRAILGAIIMVAVFGLIDAKYWRYLWRNERSDFYMLLLTFVVTLIVGVKEGIIAGMGASILVLIKQVSNPHIAVLAKFPRTNIYRNVARFTDLEDDKEVLIIRQDAPLFFANGRNFTDRVKREAEQKSPQLKLVVLAFGSVGSIDMTAYQALEQMIDHFHRQGIQVSFAGVIGPVRDLFARAGLMQKLGDDCFFNEVCHAIDYFKSEQKQRTDRFRQIAVQSNTRTHL